MAILKEFIGFGGYNRPAEGFLSWQHLLFVSILNAVSIILAFWYGNRMRSRTEAEKNHVLAVTGVAVNVIEILKIVLVCISTQNPLAWLNNLPLFLCSIQLIAIPMAAFCTGRVKEASLDFVCIFGILGALLGTYGAGQNYNAYPVLSFDNVISGVTHCISGFASLYIMFSGMCSMKKNNIVITLAILCGFCIAAYIANVLIDYNYMFLMAGDGTPYDILYNLVGGHKILYPAGVVLLFFLYIAGFYWVYFKVTKKKAAAVN